MQKNECARGKMVHIICGDLYQHNGNLPGKCPEQGSRNADQQY